ncbi:hypothetical protein M3M35_05210 [Fructilactobacillus myrtifloralis]|uniref:LPXTG cell wall anchor domain-containing protein n=1 Tax=Fructilactobacillus myrtifloralis TaxID=2940301 RepID=A0ABY5BR51_9LACO|nr:hypothetical protein [Fructilactobacillus myrtifloralis]USS84708.1 hypothetical protein M3M35_05210 [Fructilactobacillus myrtifloralis]
MKFDKQKAFLFAILGLALIAVIFGTSSIYADNQFSSGTSKQGSAGLNISPKKTNKENKNKESKQHQKSKPSTKNDNEGKESPMASVKPAPVTQLPQTGQFLHVGVTATGIVVLFLVSLIVINSHFQAKLKALDEQHDQ